MEATPQLRMRRSFGYFREWVWPLRVVRRAKPLLRKLSKLNLDDCILSWLHDYLCNRQQAIIVDGDESERAHPFYLESPKVLSLDQSYFLFTSVTSQML